MSSSNLYQTISLSGKNTVKMKDTSIEWLGQIPENWSVLPLKRLCSIGTGNRDTIEAKEDGDYPFFVRSPEVQRIDTYSYEGEAVLTAGDGDVGKIFHYINGKYDCHQRVYNFTNFKTILPKYGYYYLTSNFHFEVDKGTAKSTVPSLRMPMIAAFPVAFPDINNQQLIVNYLDDQCDLIDSQIAAAKETIYKLEEIKQALFNDIMIKGLHNTSDLVDSDIEWLGKTPSHWKQYRLKHILDESDVRSIEGLEEPLSMSQKFGLVKSSELNVPNPAFSYVNYKLVSPGQIVFNKLKAHLGVFAVSNLSGLVSPDYAVYSVKEGFIPQYLVYLFKTPSCIQEFKKYISGVAVGLMRLYTDDLFNIRVSIPSIEEQREIVDYMDFKTSAINGLIDSMESKVVMLNELKSSLVYEYVSGKKQIQGA